MNQTNLAVIPRTESAIAIWSDDQVNVIKTVICPGITDPELTLFAVQCQRTGLDPLNRQIYAVKRWDNKTKSERMTIQVGIDGLRLIAKRTGDYCPGRAPTHEHDKDGNLVSSTAYVMTFAHGSWLEVSATAFWAEYVQTNRDGQPAAMWAKGKHFMLDKCAESLALRRAFPQETSGLYTGDEMAQADNETPAKPPVIIEQGTTGAAETPAEPAKGAIPTTDPPPTATTDNWREKIRSRYFAIAKDTDYGTDAGRAAFLFEWTAGKSNSLSGFLATALPEEGKWLLEALETRLKNNPPPILPIGTKDRTVDTTTGEITEPNRKPTTAAEKIRARFQRNAANGSKDLVTQKQIEALTTAFYELVQDDTVAIPVIRFLRERETDPLADMTKGEYAELFGIVNDPEGKALLATIDTAAGRTDDEVPF